MTKAVCCVDSISRTIKKRIESNYHKCEEILKIADHGLLAGMGNSKTAITLFEAQVVPAVLFNCESGIGLNKNHINALQSFQDAFICRLQHLPRMGMPKSLVRMDRGMMLMKYRVAERKLQFLNRIRTKDNENMAKRTINNI